MFLSKRSTVIGLDIGSHSIKLSEINLSKKGYELRHFAMTDLEPDIIVDGVIQDHGAVVDAIKRLIKSERVKIKNVVTGISGESVVIKKINLPQMSYAELVESIMVEAEQYIPYDVDDVNLDFQILKGVGEENARLDNEEEGSEEDEEQMDVLLVAAKKDIIEDRIQVLKESGLRPVVVDVDAFAIENGYEINYGAEDDVVGLVDIGASITNINILENGNTAFTKDLFMGGNTYNQDLQRELEVSEELAEKLKFGRVLEGFNHEDIIPIIISTTKNIANEVNKSFEFYSTAANKTLDRVILSGGCAHINGIIKIFFDIFGIQVEISNPFKNILIDGKRFDEEYIRWAAPIAATSVGLAIRRFDDNI